MNELTNQYRRMAVETNHMANTKAERGEVRGAHHSYRQAQEYIDQAIQAAPPGPTQRLAQSIQQLITHDQTNFHRFYHPHLTPRGKISPQTWCSIKTQEPGVQNAFLAYIEQLETDHNERDHEAALLAQHEHLARINLIHATTS